MSLKYNGFTLIETLMAVTVLFLSLLLIVPSFVLVQQERKMLYTEIDMIDSLRSELNDPNSQDMQLPYEMSITLSGNDAHFHFTKDGNFKKGCAKWETNQSKEKTFCLYRSVE